CFVSLCALNCEYFGVFFNLSLNDNLSTVKAKPSRRSRPSDPEILRILFSRAKDRQESTPLPCLFASHDDDEDDEDDGGDGLDLEKETEAERAEILKDCFLLFVISAEVPFLLLPLCSPLCPFPIAESSSIFHPNSFVGTAKKVDVEVAKPIVSCIPDLDSQYTDLSSTGSFSPGCWKTFDLAKMLKCLHNMLAENL
ncbi:unnamed protein product, partial [Musa acuminata var. zebrina]